MARSRQYRKRADLIPTVFLAEELNAEIAESRRELGKVKPRNTRNWELLLNRREQRERRFVRRHTLLPLLPSVGILGRGINHETHETHER